MNRYWYFSCGGTCGGPVRVYAGNMNEAKLLAEEECDCDGCCVLLGAEAGAEGFELLTAEQKAFVPSEEFLRTARDVRGKGVK